VYWLCFREGRDDARYLYTLQQAIVERQGARDAACRRRVAAGKALLQATWDAIRVQKKYLAEGMWPSEEFNARRWQIALAIRDLLACPVVRADARAPSVLVDRIQTPPQDTDQAFLDRAAAAGLLEVRDLGGDFSRWVNVTGEGRITVTPEAGRNGKPGLRWEVAVDHKTDGGGETGKYPVGWPRIYRDFKKPALDMAAYDYLLFLIRVDSDRDEVADDSTPVGFTIHSNKFFEVSRDLGGRQRVWVPVIFPVRDMIAQVGRGEKPWHAIERVQFFIAERRYAHGTHLRFDIAEVKLLRFKAPVIRSVSCPAVIMLPKKTLTPRVLIMGRRPAKRGALELEAVVLDERGRKLARCVRDLAADDVPPLDLTGVQPGTCRLRVAVRTPDGAEKSRVEQSLECLPGPFFGAGSARR
jgi:hypothetical protein